MVKRHFSKFLNTIYIISNVHMKKNVYKNKLTKITHFRFVNSFVFYGVSLNAGALAGDIFVDNTLSKYVDFK